MKYFQVFIFSLALPTLSFICMPSFVEAATTTVKIYPTDDGFNQLYDNESQADWSSARGYTGGLYKTPVTSTDTISIRSDNQASGNYRIYRASMVFDTSAIPDNATIESASLNLYKEPLANAGNIETVVMAHTRASTTSLAKSDWYITNYGTTAFDREQLLNSQYTTFDFNSAGKSHLDLDGYTTLGVMTEFDFDNVTPSPLYNIKSATFYTIEATGTSTDPYLEITYYD